MAHLNETKAILVEVLKVKIGDDCAIKVKLGTAELVIQRVRVELSRARKKVEKRGLKVPYFRLMANIFRKADQNYDLVVFKKMREPEIAIEMDDISKIMHEVIEEQRSKEEELRKRGGFTIKVKGSAA